MTAYSRRDEHVREVQEMRQKRFPALRIAFLPGPYRSSACITAASHDQNMMCQYASGQITFDMLRREIAESNKLDKCWDDGMIPKAMMWNELQLLGWVQKWETMP